VISPAHPDKLKKDTATPPPNSVRAYTWPPARNQRPSAAGT